MNSSNSSSGFLRPSEQEQFLIDFVSLYINDICGFILFTIGIVFNLLSFVYFQLSKSFKDTSMRHYFSVISITDSLRLCEWLIAFLTEKKLFYLNNDNCRPYLFVSITSGQISIWLLVFLSIERYIILQFPFKGKRFYTTRNSLRMLCAVIFILCIFDIPYLMPKFVGPPYINYNLHVVICPTYEKYGTYRFINNVLFYALIPFFLLLIFNSLLINLLARQKSQFISVIQSSNAGLNAKRERQFKETTILLIVVTFYLLITVSPRYITDTIFMFVQYADVPRIVIAKCLNILEMFNFSLNFFFYIMCSKTSRNELHLILYYLLYWKWSDKAKKSTICNHPDHNRDIVPQRTLSTNSRHYHGSSTNINESRHLPQYTNTTSYSIHGEKKGTNIYTFFKRKSRLKIYCYLDYATRNRATSTKRRPSVGIQPSVTNQVATESNMLYASSPEFQANLNEISNSNYKLDKLKNLFNKSSQNKNCQGAEVKRQTENLDQNNLTWKMMERKKNLSNSGGFSSNEE